MYVLKNTNADPSNLQSSKPRYYRWCMIYVSGIQFSITQVKLTQPGKIAYNISD